MHLTDHDATSTPAPTGRLPTEIEITPEMMEAGLKVCSLLEAGDPDEWLVSAVYSAMERAKEAAAHRPEPV